MGDCYRGAVKGRSVPEMYFISVSGMQSVHANTCRELDIDTGLTSW